MDSKTIAADLEARAEKAGVPIYTVCDQAGIAPSTFYRWKEGSGATLGKINAISKRLDEIEAERAS